MSRERFFNVWTMQLGESGRKTSSTYNVRVAMLYGMRKLWERRSKMLRKDLLQNSANLELKRENDCVKNEVIEQIMENAYKSEKNRHKPGTDMRWRMALSQGVAIPVLGFLSGYRSGKEVPSDSAMRMEARARAESYRIGFAKAQNENTSAELRDHLLSRHVFYRYVSQHYRTPWMLDVRAPIFVATAVLVCCALSIFTKTDLTFALLAGTSAGVFVGAFVDNITAAKTEMRVKDSTEEIDVELDAERSHYQDLRQFMQINLNILPSEAKHALQNLAQTPDSFKNTKTKKIKKRKIATVASNAA